MTRGPDPYAQNSPEGRHEGPGQPGMHPQRRPPSPGRHDPNAAGGPPPGAVPDILTPEAETKRRRRRAVPQAVPARPAAVPIPAPKPSTAPPVDPTLHEEADKPDDASVMRIGGSIAIATLASRVTGFIRTVLVVALLGAVVSSAFQAAYVLPNMIAEVLLGAVLTAIVIPVLVRAEKEDGDGGQDFINRIYTLTVVILGIGTVIAVLAAPLLTILNVGDDAKVDRSLVTALAYLLLPGILFYGLSALFMAILNVKNVFKPGAWAPVVNNLVQIATLVLFWMMGEPTFNPVKMNDPQLLVLGIGTTIGVIVQAAMLLPYLRRAGVRLQLKWGIDSRLRQFGNMALAIIAYVLILQVGLVITYRIGASATESGIIAYATHWQLLQLPYGVLGVTILTAIMPRLSRNAADGDRDAVIDDMSLATRLTMIALVPTVAYMTFFGPAIGLAIFNFGKFGADEASQLGSVLAWGAFTLIPYAMTLVQLRVFYAREDAWTPTYMVLGITIVKVALSYLGPVLFSDDPQMIVRWLAFSNGLGYLVGAIVGHYLLAKRLGGARMTDVARTSYLSIVVSVVVAAAIWGIAKLTGFDKLSTQGGLLGALAYLAITGVVVLGVTYLVLTGLKLPDMVTISNSVRRLLGRFIPKLAPPVAEPAGGPATGGFGGLAPAENTMTIRFGSIADETMPFASQVGVQREFDTSTSSWKAVPVSSGGAIGATTVIPKVVDGPPMAPPPEPAPLPGQLPSTLDPSQRATRQYQSPQAAQPPTEPPAEAGSEAAPGRPVRLVSGAVVGGGRYALLEQHGGARGLQFWHARDNQLGREVGLTFVDPDQRFPAYRPGDPTDTTQGPQGILNRTRRLGQLRTPGVAQVLDVVRSSSGGIVVTEWVRGSSLADVAATSPSANGSARAVRALAGGAEAAHRAGAALSIDHPDRIRVSVDGDAVLAFPAVLEGDDSQTDVRGLGAVLYALLLNRWPLDGETGKRLNTTAVNADPVGGMAPAVPDSKDAHRPVTPATVRREVPVEISAVTSRALEGSSGIRTAGTVAHILDSATVVDLPTEVIPLTGDVKKMPPVSVAPLARSRKERLLGEGEAGKRNSALLIGAGLFVLFVVAAIVLWLINPFSDDPEDEFDSFLPSATSGQAEPEPTEAATARVVIRGVTVYDPDGEADTSAAQNPRNVINGGSPPWKTSEYRGTGKFGGLKEGIGLMLRVQPGSQVREVTIATQTPGMSVEIRGAKRAKPRLTATSVVGEGTVAQAQSTVRLETPTDAPYVLVWITELGQIESGDYQAIIEKITLLGS